MVPKQRNLSSTFDKPDVAGQKASSQYSPQKKVIIKTAGKQSKTSVPKTAAISNHTVDSTKSLNALPQSSAGSNRKGATVKLAKVKTSANLRAQSSSQ